MAKKENKERKVKFIPAEGSTLFAGDRPVKAILKDTRDPRIKKIKKDEDHQRSDEYRAVEANLPTALYKKLHAEAKKNGHSVSSQISILLNRHFESPAAPAVSPLQDLVEYVMGNIIEAVDLILDAADMQQKERTFRTLHHALKTLIDIKKSPGGLTEAKKQRLTGILEDLNRLRSIADQEEKERTSTRR